MRADGVGVRIHPQALEEEFRMVPLDLRVHAHGRGVADPVVLRPERAAHVRPVAAHLFLALVELVVVRRVRQLGVIGIDAHHEIEVLLGQHAPCGMERDLDIADGQDVCRRAAIGLRPGAGRQAQQQPNNDEKTAHFFLLGGAPDTPRGQFTRRHLRLLKTGVAPVDSCGVPAYTARPFGPGALPRGRSRKRHRARLERLLWGLKFQDHSRQTH